MSDSQVEVTFGFKRHLFGLHTFLVPIAIISKLFGYQACVAFLIFVFGNFVAMNKPFDANLQF